MPNYVKISRQIKNYLKYREDILRNCIRNKAFIYYLYGEHKTVPSGCYKRRDNIKKKKDRNAALRMTNPNASALKWI